MTTLAPTLATTALATSTLPSRFRRRAYALAAALSLSAICSAELRVAFWPMLAAWPHAGSPARSRTAPPAQSREVAVRRALRRARQRSPQSGLHAGRMAHHMTDKQRATAAKQKGR